MEQSFNQKHQDNIEKITKLNVEDVENQINETYINNGIDTIRKELLDFTGNDWAEVRSSISTAESATEVERLAATEVINMLLSLRSANDNLKAVEILKRLGRASKVIDVATAYNFFNGNAMSKLKKYVSLVGSVKSLYETLARVSNKYDNTEAGTIAGLRMSDAEIEEVTKRQKNIKVL